MKKIARLRQFCTLRALLSDRKQPKSQKIAWSFIWHKGDVDLEKWALCNSLVLEAEKSRNNQNIFAFKMLLKHPPGEKWSRGSKGSFQQYRYSLSFQCAK